jgi:hypothetical protein
MAVDLSNCDSALVQSDEEVEKEMQMPDDLQIVLALPARPEESINFMPMELQPEDLIA